MLERISILGSGWLGLPLAHELQQAGYLIKTSSRSTARINQIQNMGITTCRYDIESTNNDESLLQTDILIINITNKNVDAFRSLISNIETSSISKVLFISSTSVYADSDNPNQAAITEVDLSALKPCPLLDIENLFRNNIHFKTSIIRFAGLIGYQRHPGNFFLLKDENNNLSCKPIRNPEGYVNMIHRDDCIGIIKALLQQNYWGEVFNACSNEHPTRRDFYQQALEHISNIEAIFVQREGFLSKKISNDKIIQFLDYRFIHNDLLDFESHTYD